MKIYSDVTRTVGGTPLIRLSRLGQGLPGEVVVKTEGRNPLGSIKDRIAVNMIDDAEQKGTLKAGGVLIEPTSGNTGVGLAMVAAARGYRLIITIPDSMSVERRMLLSALGAEVVLTPGSEGMKGAIAEAERIQAKTEGAMIVGQFDNPANPAIHECQTAGEIWDDTEGKVDIVVGGVGTGGTITGLARRLKSEKPGVIAIAVEPSDSPVLSGGSPGPHKIQGIGAGFVPGVYDASIIDEVIKVEAQDAGNTARDLARKEGILVGISSGAAAWAALSVAARPQSQGKLIVAILPDTGERYLSTWLFTDK